VFRRALQDRRYVDRQSNVEKDKSRRYPSASDMAADILRAWLETEFAGGRHARRVEKIADIERRHPEGRP
jgi:ribose 5-phosphate isomerase RpiB